MNKPVASPDKFTPNFFLIIAGAEQPGLSPAVIHFYEQERLIAPKQVGIAIKE